MNEEAQLERGYRRLLACYPSTFRRAHEEELLAVLLESAREGQRHPGVADAANLLCHALRLRIAPPRRRSTHGVPWAVRLMLLTAFLNLVAFAVVVSTEDAVSAAAFRGATSPIAQPPGGLVVLRFVRPHLPVLIHNLVVFARIAAPIAVVGWLVLAWAAARGRRWGRIGTVAMFVLTLLGLLVAVVAGHAAAYAAADLIAVSAVCLSALATTALILSASSRADNGPATSPRP